MHRMLVVFFILLFTLKTHAFVIYGDTEDLGKGLARTFVDMNEFGEPLEIGVALTKEALDGLPMHPSLTILRLPSVLNIPPFNHITVDWMPHGHEPDPIYGLPHFDFHFYQISSEAREAITCMGEDAAICTKPIEPDMLPPFYVPGPTGVPKMGWHWVDPRSPEFNGKTFTTTFIYGYYDGKLNFIEPMMTRDFLLSVQNTSYENNIPIPKKVQNLGFYPQAYSVKYDRTKKMYLIALKKIILVNDDVSP